MKAFESCWGEDNVKLYTVNLKQAIAKCSQVDAPELSLPPFRSPYRLIKIIIHMYTVVVTNPCTHHTLI